MRLSGGSLPAAMRVHATTDAPLQTKADTIAIGLFEDEGIAHDVEGNALAALVDAGEARPGLRKLAVTHAEGRRFILAGLGSREAFDAERARVVAAVVHGRAAELGTRTLCWELPHHVDDEVAAGLVEGTALGRLSVRSLQERARGPQPGRGASDLRAPRHRRSRRGRGDPGRRPERRARPPEHARQRHDPHEAGRTGAGAGRGAGRAERRSGGTRRRSRSAAWGPSRPWRAGPTRSRR